MREQLSRDSRGTYQRDLGWKQDGDSYKQHRFYLGRDRAQALVRCLALEKVWDAVCKRWQKGGSPATRPARPVWDADTLAIAQAVSRGESRVELSSVRADGLPVKADTAVAWLLAMREDFAEVDVEIHLADQAAQTRGLADLESAAAGYDHVRQFIRKTGSGKQTLHQAIDAFAAHIRETYIDPETRTLTPTGANYCRQLGFLKQHQADVPLARFDLEAIDRLVNYWRNRPLGKRGKPMAAEFCRHMIKRVRAFIRWLHKSPSWEWRKPADYEAEPIRIAETREEVARKATPHQVKTHTPEQIGVLWEYATPNERLLLLLGLNCGFGAAEVGSLRLDEVSEGHIRRVRFKSQVYGEWRLWDVTVAALAWWKTRRPESEEPYVLLTDRGRPLHQMTEAQNRSSHVGNVWNRLTARVRKDYPDFPSLSFNKVRKTAANLIRRASDGETAGVFLAHGQPVRSDDLSEVYSNRDFSKVFAAQARVWDILAPLFAAVSEPFPAVYTINRPALGLRVIKRIHAMKAQGFTAVGIARELNISKQTVHYWLHKARKEAQAKERQADQDKQGE